MKIMIPASSEFSKPWREFTFVAFDLETSGAYPLGSEIVEFGAVKWKGDQEIDSFQTLLKPTEPMSAFNMSIHGISNEMVAEAPRIEERISEIRRFMDGCILMAHHAPFDLGFVTADFENYRQELPSEPVICTSLLARKLITESPNHKLQTLIKVLNLVGGQAHRGLDDARACLQLGILCMNRLSESATLDQVYEAMGKRLFWKDYICVHSTDEKIKTIVMALKTKAPLDIVYLGGSLKGTRRILPQGIVRNPDGDYVQAICHIDRISKRFYLEKIQEIKSV